jgi:hypothetical protein
MERSWVSSRTRLRQLTNIDAIHVANIHAAGLRTKQWGNRHLQWKTGAFEDLGNVPKSGQQTF